MELVPNVEDWELHDMIAALYVETNGVYFHLEGVDPYDVTRDARKYDGPLSVVAHPPCERWCALAKANESRYGLKVGDDGGTFEHARNCVRKFGGVLEHPARSLAWKAFGLRRPVLGEWTHSPDDDSYVTEVYQSVYGHRAEKKTWLYYVGARPFDLDWSIGKGIARISKGPGSNMPLPQMSTKEACRSPIRFAETLIKLASASRG